VKGTHPRTRGPWPLLCPASLVPGHWAYWGLCGACPGLDSQLGRGQGGKSGPAPAGWGERERSGLPQGSDFTQSGSSGSGATPCTHAPSSIFHPCTVQCLAPMHHPAPCTHASPSTLHPCITQCLAPVHHPVPCTRASPSALHPCITQHLAPVHHPVPCTHAPSSARGHVPSLHRAHAQSPL